VRIVTTDGHGYRPEEVSTGAPIPFPLRAALDVVAETGTLPPGKHQLELAIESTPFGPLKLEVEDTIAAGDQPARVVVPRSRDDDYAPEAIAQRQAFAEAFSGAKLHHVRQPSFDPHLVQGNCELFTGVAQIPLGIAGPIRIDGEHAQGEFLVPLATTEGTLVASYNRGIQLLNLSGGVKCTVVGDAMQRARCSCSTTPRRPRVRALGGGEPAAHPRGGRGHVERGQAQLHRPVPRQQVRLPALQLHHRRRAGQNMVGRATFAACSWILDHYQGVRHFYLESNFATDKKASQVNIMRTRGKRVTAECTVKRDVLIERMRVEPEQLAYHAGVANVGRLHVGREQQRRPLGQRDHRDVHRHRAGRGQRRRVVGRHHLRRADAGEGPLPVDHDPLAHRRHARRRHGAATQRECLELLGCTGRGKVNKFAEIVAGVGAGGELSLALGHLVERLGVEPRALRAATADRPPALR
jgi:hydroxymethylglutaryl-CoA reductase (NADPH)